MEANGGLFVSLTEPPVLESSSILENGIRVNDQGHAAIAERVLAALTCWDTRAATACGGAEDYAAPLTTSCPPVGVGWATGPRPTIEGDEEGADVIPVGTPVPEFALPDQYGRLRRLPDLVTSGGAVLVFLPLAFSRTCTAELGELRDNAELFAGAGLQVVGITVDSKHVLRAWAEELAVGFPLLSDFWPHGEVTRAFGSFRERLGYASRATFILDAEGVVRSAFTSPPGLPRPLSAYQDALAALAAG
ncbi:MAG: peroxiredoxin [Naasia sp.]|nr:peroxiredoxin [Naasia sp.]